VNLGFPPRFWGVLRENLSKYPPNLTEARLYQKTKSFDKNFSFSVMFALWQSFIALEKRTAPTGTVLF